MFEENIIHALSIQTLRFVKGRIKMILKRIIAGICALSAGICATALSCFAAESTDSEVYGQAGIVWMIRDYWDHRNDVGLEPLDEYEENVISCTHTDVNITGNGQYEAIFEGYVVPEDVFDVVAVGNLALEITIDFDKNPDCVVTLDECTIDDTVYTFNTQPELEDVNGVKQMKVKNPYGVNADTTPEMDVKPWNTTSPISIKFTVSGLDKDKIADYADEKIVTVYGNGSVENDPSDEPAEEELSSADESSTVAESKASTADSSKASDPEKDDGGNTVLYICIAAGAVIILAVVIVVVVKKKK